MKRKHVTIKNTDKSILLCWYTLRKMVINDEMDYSDTSNASDFVVVINY